MSKLRLLCKASDRHGWNRSLTRSHSTEFDYLCAESATALLPSTSSIEMTTQMAKRQARPECVTRLANYRRDYGIAAACSCVLESMSPSTTVVETATVFTGTTVTRTSTVSPISKAISKEHLLTLSRYETLASSPAESRQAQAFRSPQSSSPAPTSETQP